MREVTDTEKFKLGRVDGKNSAYKSGQGRRHPKLRDEIERVLQTNKDLAAHKDKKVGQLTQDKRRTVIYGFFSDVRHLGYKVESIYSIKDKHLQAVFRFLEEQEQSPSTIQNKISIMRVFCEWIGKPGMVKESSKYVADPRSAKRTMVVREDKSWEGKGVDVMSVLSSVMEKDKVVAIVLELSLAFGLRVLEALMVRPLADRVDNTFFVREGTKGGRPRVVPIENAIQEDVLRRAGELVDLKTGFLGETGRKRGYTIAQKKRRFYYVLESCGVTLKDLDVTAHGLRHQYMQESFERLLGIPAPVKGGDLRQVDKLDLLVASQQFMERAGHTRVSIGASYYGSRRIPAGKQ